MIRFLTLLAATVYPGLLLAQDVTVRGGEHIDFTRLVFDIPVGTGWEIEPGPNKNQFRLSLNIENARFDTAPAFQKITRDRIRDLRMDPAESSILIDLACDCAANAFVLRDRMLVVDFNNNVVNEPEEPRVPLSVLAKSQTDDVAQTDLAKLWLGSDARIGPERPTSPMMLGIPLANQVDRNPKESPAVLRPQPEINIVRGQIFDDVASAASQGFLQHTRTLGRPPQVEAPDETNHLGPIVEPTNNNPILDRALVEGGRISIGGRQCIPDKMLNIAKWEDSTADVSLAMSTRRGAIFGEFDKINNSAAYSYVKSLLYFGFGAEARQALSMIERHPNKVLLALSYLVDGEHDPSRLFGPQSDCEGLSSVWAAIDGTGLSSDSKMDQAAILRGFEMLPPHLREFLGPKISENLVAHGFTSTAKNVLRRLE